MGRPHLSLTHLVRRPRAADRPPLLVLLHGYGSNEQDLLGLAPYLDPRLLIVSPRAPHTLMPGGYAWFSLDFTPEGIGVERQQAEASRALVADFVAEAVTAYAADPARVFLGGFSQGGMLTAAVVLTRPELLAGALLLSGMAQRELLPALAPHEQLAGKPILVQHGIYDQVLPVELARAGRDLLAGLPVALTYREYPMAHEISAVSLGDMAAWLAARLD
jgi:phospholipase/carboxylesterase